MKDKLLKIIQKYGIEHQQRKLEEEVFELQQAITIFENTDISDYLDGKKALKDDIKEELADVMVLLQQIGYYYELDDLEINKIIQFKVDRQLERMKNE